MEVAATDAGFSGIDKDELFENFQESEGKFNGRVYSYGKALKTDCCRGLSSKIDFSLYNHREPIANQVAPWTCQETEKSATVSIGGTTDSSGNSSIDFHGEAGINTQDNNGNSYDFRASGDVSIDNQGNVNSSGQISISIKG